MDLSFTEEQEILRKFAQDFLTSKFPKKLVKEIEESDVGYSPEIWKEMAELGWMGLPFPEKYGGTGMTFLDLAVLLEEMGKACMPGPYFSTVILGAFPILDVGTEGQKQEYLPKVTKGEAILTLALTEPSGSYDAASTEVKAVPSGDAWTITGTKLFVPDAHVADYVLCVTQTEEMAKPEEGLTIFIVEAKGPGMGHTALKTMADKLCEVVFDEVKVSKESILGELNQGWNEVKRVINRAEAAKCCQIAGMAQKVLDMTVEYAKERKQFDRPIGSFQAIQHYCADMLIDVEGMRLSTYQAAWKLSEGLPCAEEVAVAKAWAVQAGERVISLAHQVHSAIGVTMEHDLHYYTRRLKASELSFGDIDSYRELVAQGMGL
ncbi:MAG TPA: acyl-CoA/acyl-ACP dehydrogenase [Dehalococcoidia bacterium]|nr:acyl-CoA/acyl-ACP dehydrogenase [Dehalococcoidia bacterium]